MINLYNNDCITAMDEMIANGVQVDLTVTSPPYDNLRTYEGSCQWNFDVFKNVADRLYKITKDGGIIVWIVADATIKGSETGTSFKQALYFKEIGFNLHDTMIWQKKNPIPLNHNRYEQCFEYMFILSKDKPKTFNPIRVPCTTVGFTSRKRSNKESGSAVRNRDVITERRKDKIKKNIWDCTVSNTKFNHPAIFPLNLIEDHIISWSNENDIILDPFMGSGTTGVACKKLNRNFIGVEIVDKYFDIACERIKEVKNEI